MNDTLDRIRKLVASGQARVSDHGYDELAKDGIIIEDVINGVATARVVEDYPSAAHGPSVLVLQTDADGRPIHIVWGIPARHAGPAVVVTGYRPDPARWSEGYLKRVTR